MKKEDQQLLLKIQSYVNITASYAYSLPFNDIFPLGFLMIPRADPGFRQSHKAIMLSSPCISLRTVQPLKVSGIV